MNYLIIKNNNLKKSYKCKNTYTNKPFIHVSGEYLDLTTDIKSTQSDLIINVSKQQTSKSNGVAMTENTTVATVLTTAYSGLSSRSSSYTSTTGYSGISSRSSTYTLTTAISGVTSRTSTWTETTAYSGYYSSASTYTQTTGYTGSSSSTKYTTITTGISRPQFKSKYLY